MYHVRHVLLHNALTQHIQTILQVSPGPFPQFLGQDLGTRLFDNNIKVLFPEKFMYITSSILKVIHTWLWDQEEIEQ